MGQEEQQRGIYCITVHVILMFTFCEPVTACRSDEFIVQYERMFSETNTQKIGYFICVELY